MCGTHNSLEIHSNGTHNSLDHQSRHPQCPHVSALISLPMSFMYKEKRRGDRRHPCLTTFVGCTRALFSPSIKMYSSFSYICLITLSKVDGIALRRRCDQSCCLETVSYACKKSMKATCNLGLFLGFSFFAACLRCLRINRGCRVLLPAKRKGKSMGIKRVAGLA